MRVMGVTLSCTCEQHMLYSLPCHSHTCRVHGFPLHSVDYVLLWSYLTCRRPASHSGRKVMNQASRLEASVWCWQGRRWNLNLTCSSFLCSIRGRWGFHDWFLFSICVMCVHCLCTFNETSIIRTSLGPPLTVLFMEVSLIRRFVCMYTWQCKGCQMGQSSGVLLKEVAVFRRCLCIWDVLSDSNVF